MPLERRRKVGSARRAARSRGAEDLVRSAAESALHLVVLDGAWHENSGELAWEGLGHLRTSEVGEVVGCLVRRIERHRRRCSLLGTFGDEPAGPQWVSRLAPLAPDSLGHDSSLLERRRVLPLDGDRGVGCRLAARPREAPRTRF
jgi:hypothetical protein